MRPPADYTLLRDFKVPGSPYVTALRAGDEITEAGRLNAGLVVGLDVTPLRDDVIARPADDAPRSAWQDYAVSRGVPYTEAADLDAAELRSRLETQESPAAADNAGTMPEPGDRKQRWADYATLEIVHQTGGQVAPDTARERVSGLTKAELVDKFGPDSTDEARADLLTVPGSFHLGGPLGDLVIADDPATPERPADPVAEQA